MTIVNDNDEIDPPIALESNVAARCRMVVGFESIPPARVSLHTRGMVSTFAGKHLSAADKKEDPAAPN